MNITATAMSRATWHWRRVLLYSNQSHQLSLASLHGR